MWSAWFLGESAKRLYVFRCELPLPGPRKTCLWQSAGLQRQQQQQEQAKRARGTGSAKQNSTDCQQRLRPPRRLQRATLPDRGPSGQGRRMARPAPLLAVSRELVDNVREFRAAARPLAGIERPAWPSCPSIRRDPWHGTTTDSRSQQCPITARRRRPSTSRPSAPPSRESRRKSPPIPTPKSSTRSGLPSGARFPSTSAPTPRPSSSSKPPAPRGRAW